MEIYDEKIVLEVIDKDARLGVPKSVYHCPIALALIRELGSMCHPEVGDTGVSFDDPDDPARYELDEAGQHFIRVFDKLGWWKTPCTVVLTRIRP